VRITSRPKRPLPTIVELSDADAPVLGRAMVDEVEMVHKDDLDDRRGSLSPGTMRAIDDALRHVFSLN
jgi:mRNA-degrading endonuclease toxin of MazEF toxin-antitoxin module